MENGQSLSDLTRFFAFFQVDDKAQSRARGIPEEVEREIKVRGEDPREFRRLHRDLIALSRPGDWWEQRGVERLAIAWWKKVRRILGWLGAGEARCEDLDRQLDEGIRLLLLMQSAQHRWWKSRLRAVLGSGLRNPEDVRCRIEGDSSPLEAGREDEATSASLRERRR